LWRVVADDAILRATGLYNNGEITYSPAGGLYVVVNVQILQHVLVSSVDYVRP
jgi:hypothetical protein